MVGWLQKQGVAVTNAAGGMALPDPVAIGTHEPDAIGKKDAVLWIGEAKVGTDLYTEHSQEQLREFSRRQMSDTGRPCPFILCVPKGWTQRARQAVVAAGGNTQNLTVIA
jgi:hypothetical protein